MIARSSTRRGLYLDPPVPSSPKPRSLSSEIPRPAHCGIVGRLLRGLGFLFADLVLLVELTGFLPEIAGLLVETVVLLDYIRGNPFGLLKVFLLPTDMFGPYSAVKVAYSAAIHLYLTERLIHLPLRHIYPAGRYFRPEPSVPHSPKARSSSREIRSSGIEPRSSSMEARLSSLKTSLPGTQASVSS